MALSRQQEHLAEDAHVKQIRKQREQPGEAGQNLQRSPLSDIILSSLYSLQNSIPRWRVNAQQVNLGEHV